MKAGLPASIALHVLLIGLGLVSLSKPRSFDVSDVEALPVDIVPIEELTQVQEGAKDAPKTAKPAPKPTAKKDPVPEATKTGDNKVDLPNDFKPDIAQKPIEKTVEPPPQPKPVAQPSPKPEPEPEPAKPEPPKPVTEPTPKLATEAKPKQEIAPDPAPQPDQQAPAEAEFADLPAVGPSIAARPQPPKAQTAETPKRKVEQDKTATSAPQNETKDKAIEDQVAALLNKEKASGGGAKRSSDQASLGAKKTTGGTKLSASEMDALRQQIQKCWNPPFGVDDAGDLKVTIKMRLTPDGEIDGRPEVVSGGSNSGIGRAAAESARRAVMICAPYALPADKYDDWQDVVVNFDPRDLFR